MPDGTADVVMLSVDRPYALVGQAHPGFMGLIQRSLSRGAAHIWFQVQFQLWSVIEVFCAEIRGRRPAGGGAEAAGARNGP